MEENQGWRERFPLRTLVPVAGRVLTGWNDCLNFTSAIIMGNMDQLFEWVLGPILAVCERRCCSNIMGLWIPRNTW